MNNGPFGPEAYLPAWNKNGKKPLTAYRDSCVYYEQSAHGLLGPFSVFSQCPFEAFRQNGAKSGLKFADYSDGVVWDEFTDRLRQVRKRPKLTLAGKKKGTVPFFPHLSEARWKRP